jgi:molybdopterin-containing oxidoreductase family membrane subunit
MDTTTQERLVEPGQTYSSITDNIAGIPLTPIRRTRLPWVVGFFIAFIGAMILLMAITVLFIKGVGIWGVNIPVGWGFAIVNFVWWIGIGHAGTLISAVLLLVKQDWRNSINRFAEAMTIFAVAMAGLFPILHLGRPWYFIWLIPYPNTMHLWPNFRSPLVWDVFAITTYLTISILFWFMGLVPDLATMREKATNIWLRRFYGVLSLGWRNSNRHWHNYKSVYYLIAALATPLVFSVHSIVGMDFAYGIVPGWHSTIFPPYFVAGAVFSGFAMVLTLMIPLRAVYPDLKNYITERHLSSMAKVMLAMGLLVAYGYMMEIFWGFFSGDVYDRANTLDRFFGFYSAAYWGLLICNVGVPQVLWFRNIRRNPIFLWVIAIIINIGMWLERYIIIVQSLSKDYLPSAWHTYLPTIWDIFTFVGTIGAFLALMFLFVRLLPAISIFEVRELLHKEHKAESHGDSAQEAAAAD